MTVSQAPSAEAIGAVIRKMRKTMGYTQMRLAKRAKISQAALSNYERGFRAPPAPIVKRLARALGQDNESAILARAEVIKGMNRHEGTKQVRHHRD